MRGFRLAVPILALAAAFPLAFAAPTAGEVESLVRGGKIDDAISAGRESVTELPSDPDRRVALAHALAVKARTVRRVVEMEVDAEDLQEGGLALPKIGPDTPIRTEILYDSKLLGEALRNLNEAEKLAPARKDVRLKRCQLLADSGDVSGAIDAVRRAVAALPADPALPGDLAALGNERVEAGDPEGGARLLAAVAEAFPLDAAVAADLGQALARSGKKTESLAALDRAASSAPGDLGILRVRATMAMLLREFRRARGAYQASSASGGSALDLLGAAAAAIASDLKVAKAELADLAKPGRASAEIAEIAASLLETASRGPSDRKNVAEAKALADSGREILALPILHRALRANPADRESAALLAGIYRSFGFPTLADETIRSAAKPPPPKKPPATQPSGSSKR